MKVFKKTNSKSKLQEEQAAAGQQKEPLTPQKSEDESEDSSQDEGAEVEANEEGGAMGKIWASITGLCGGGSADASTTDEWCNMKEGMAEI